MTAPEASATGTDDRTRGLRQWLVPMALVVGMLCAIGAIVLAVTGQGQNAMVLATIAAPVLAAAVTNRQ
ncbi:hypothetical protein AB0957_35360 [Streptomyces zhihengii]|uniref:hypothetical protein n=1 Tax=Streptomyces zhihengii TaxID=1818004 RepID=UPI003452F154